MYVLKLHRGAFAFPLLQWKKKTIIITYYVCVFEA